MRLLLDTHIWIWSLLDPGRLGRRVGDELRDPANEVWLSPISVWETMLLFQRGRIVTTGDPAEWIRRALRTSPMRDAPLSREVALVGRSLQLEHDDPADRFLAASAVVHGLVLVTADSRLLDNPAYEALANR